MIAYFKDFRKGLFWRRILELKRISERRNDDVLYAVAEHGDFEVFAGLFFGKPLGIALFSVLAVRLGLSQLPGDVSWRHIIGAGFLGGIGFTMSIFITLLAFGNPEIVQSSKISILLGSLAAGTVGFLILSRQTASMSNRSA